MQVMGIDLTILPVKFEDKDGAYAFTRLNLGRDYGLWNEVKALKSEACKSLTAHLGDNYGTRKTDPYGDKLRTVHAADLAGLRYHDGVQNNEHNRAAWAYVLELEVHTKIALWWH